MKGRKELIVVIFCALLFTSLFYKQSLGLNLFIFESILFSVFFYKKQLVFKSKIQIVSISSTLLTLLFTLITHSTFSYFIHFVSFFIFIGTLNFPEVKSLVSTFKISFVSLFKNQSLFYRKAINSKIKGKKLGGFIWKSRIFFIPLLIIGFFTSIYSASNPIFNGVVSEAINFAQKAITFLFKDLELLLFFTFFLGILISNFIVIRSSNKKIVEEDLNATDNLIRSRKKGYNPFGVMALKNEYKAAIFLFIVLNLILFTLNAIDIYWVWFNFEWSGQLLKQFVHEGTYLLIFSILISIAIVLFYFRKNLNFYKKNKLLKNLGYVWIIQNAVLVISVGIRNYWYINYYSLAYKRIGVFIFLALTLYGLYTVIIKIKDTKSSYYLYKMNTLAIFIILVLSSLINWDSLIVKYNFKHSYKSYLHLSYLSVMSDKSLMYLDKPLTELIEINKHQKENFKVTKYDISPKNYFNIIEKRKRQFKKKWESKSILEWSLAEYLTYKNLFSK